MEHLIERIPANRRLYRKNASAWTCTGRRVLTEGLGDRRRREVDTDGEADRSYHTTSTVTIMGLLDITPAGVVSGKDVYKVFDYAREHKFAIPAFNVTVCTSPAIRAEG